MALFAITSCMALIHDLTSRLRYDAHLKVMFAQLGIIASAAIVPQRIRIFNSVEKWLEFPMDDKPLGDSTMNTVGVLSEIDNLTL